MRIALLAFFIGLAFSAISQPALTEARRKGYQTFVYQIPADTAEKYVDKGIKEIDHYLQYMPVVVFHSDSVRLYELPVGNYLLLSVTDSMIEAKYYNCTKAMTFVINNLIKPQLLLRDERGEIYKNATVKANGKPVPFSNNSSTFIMNSKMADGTIVRIELPGDTSFVELTKENENSYNTVRRQLKARFRSSKMGKIISWLPDRVSTIFDKRKNYNSKNKNNYRATGSGYVLFNKPKYYPSDTVKFKAYLLDKKGKQYKQGVETYLNYYSKNVSINRKLANIKPTSAGAYIYDFATGDTLPNDTKYTLQFKNKKGKVILNGQFSIEDYLLDEVATYTINSQKEKYFGGDTLQFSATAKDANGLALMDGRVKLVLVSEKINSFYKQRVFVPDTLWQEEKVLAVEGETKFRIPTINFPAADFELRAVAIFRNSNNEIQEEDTKVDYAASNTKIDIKLEKGLINAVLYKNGIAITAKGFMETDLTEDPVSISFPYAGKIDPQAENYEFYTDDSEEIDVSEDFDIPNNYTVTFSRGQQKDTVAFSLNNPHKIPVYYSLFNKDKEIFSASSTEENIIWKDKMPANKMYYLRWQYYWGGRSRYGSESVALLTKLASAEIGGANVVYPGQTDTITVKVKDYKQNGLKNVNLTAVSYNAQFAADIRVPEPPYIQKFKGKYPILHTGYQTEEVEESRLFSLGKHQGWRKQINLDTMAYYQFLFPDKHYHMVKTRIQEVLPQVSVYAVQQGVPQEIFLLYINRQLVYFNGTTSKSIYAVSQMPGYAQFVVRLKDKYVLTDSIYLQPYYKHDIVFDIDKQAKNFIVRDTVAYWTNQEKDLLNKQILRIENNNRNNSGYVWQDEKTYYLGSAGEHITGPFFNDSIQFYKPGDFDFKFNFEPGYRYKISPQVVRLEKIPFITFDNKVYLSSKGRAWWPLGDTLKELPVINYAKKKVVLPFLEQYGGIYVRNSGNERIKIELPYDSTIAFTVLQNNNEENDYRVIWGRLEMLNNINKGNYTVVMVTNNFSYLEAANIQVDSTGTYCVKFIGKDEAGAKPVYSTTNLVIQKIIERQNERRRLAEEAAAQKEKETKSKNDFYKNPVMDLPKGTGIISGRVIDNKGRDGVPGASVKIKGTRTGTAALMDGTFSLRGIIAGQHILLVTGAGYEPTDYAVSVYEGQETVVSIAVAVATITGAEVVVTALGIRRTEKALGYSVSRVDGNSLFQKAEPNLLNGLQGRVPGVDIRSSQGTPGSATRIQIRGISSLSSDTQPLIVVDGVPMHAMPDNLDSNDIASFSILKDAAATALYGSRASGGVIIITTKRFSPKMMREEFRDYAFWKPNLFTDENGEAKFVVTYPDNITSWQTYVLGMDKKHHVTKASKIVKSFKPMLAQLSAPQFLIEGDTSIAIGKKVNYTTASQNVNVEFSINGKQQNTSSEILKANDATISELKIVAASKGADTIIARFTMKAESGFADGEQRKIPVLRKGTTETIGQFNLLEGDTSISIAVNENAGEVKIYAQNNTLDILLDEIDHLKKYPYYCMEQTASKFTGLVMEKKIRETLKQNFSGEKEMNKLLTKIQKGQLFDGSWGWWEGSKPNITITNYITRALLQVRGDALLETNIRNSLLFLNNELPRMRNYDLLETLYTLSEAGHDIDYSSFLVRLNFDSLSQHQQWQMLSVLQKQKMEYEKELQKLLNKKTETMLGGLHWGEKNYWWSRNDIATTVLAYKTLGSMQAYSNEQKQMFQFFLEQRKEGHWHNTVESATVLSTILPDVLKSSEQFNDKATLRISGDTNVIVSKFPFAATLKKGTTNITATKKGGGMIYFSASQQVFNPQPIAVDSNFKLTTYFEDKNGNRITTLKAGEKVFIKLLVQAFKDADYVQLEIPVPAGCTYATKNTGSYEHREYFRDKVLVFAEEMKKGYYTYTIELEPRYTGSYVMNPAKAELMYFPVFYGRNNINTVQIVK